VFLSHVHLNLSREESILLDTDNGKQNIDLALYLVLSPNTQTVTVTRVPELPNRDCARGCINDGHMRQHISAVDTTGKTFFERLYWVLGLQKFVP